MRVVYSWTIPSLLFALTLYSAINNLQIDTSFGASKSDVGGFFYSKV